MCRIARTHRLTRAGAETLIRTAGLGGLNWCPLHRTWEEL